MHVHIRVILSRRGKPSHARAMANELDARPEGPIMDYKTFQELRLDLRADQQPTGNPNDAFDPAVAARSQQQLET